MSYADRVRSHIPDGTLIRGIHPAVYLVEHVKKRPIIDTETFLFFKFNPERIVELDEQTFAGIEMGEPVSMYQDFTTGGPSTILVKGKGSEIYLWTDRQLHPIVSTDIYHRLRFQYFSAVTLPDELISSLPEGYPIHDLTLLTHSLVNGRVYSAPNGMIYYGEQHKLRKIERPSVFFFYRLKSEEIVHLTEMEFNNCLLGDPIL